MTKDVLSEDKITRCPQCNSDDTGLPWEYWDKEQGRWMVCLNLWHNDPTVYETQTVQ